MSLPYINLDKHINQDKILSDLQNEVFQGISKYRRDKDLLKFRVKAQDTHVEKIQLSKRNAVTSSKHELFIRGEKKYWNVCEDTAIYFPTLLLFIRELPFFSEIGRMLIICSFDGHETPEHRDHGFSDLTQQFVWLRLDRNKNFYIKDSNSRKHFVDCNCLWFDSRLLHGTENSSFPSFSIRVDGVFSSKFTL